MVNSTARDPEGCSLSGGCASLRADVAPARRGGPQRCSLSGGCVSLRGQPPHGRPRCVPGCSPSGGCASLGRRCFLPGPARPARARERSGRRRPIESRGAGRPHTGGGWHPGWGGPGAGDPVARAARRSRTDGRTRAAAPPGPLTRGHSPAPAHSSRWKDMVAA